MTTSTSTPHYEPSAIGAPNCIIMAQHEAALS